MPLPQSVGNQRDQLGTSAIFLGQKVAPQGGRNPKHGKKVGRDQAAIDALRLCAASEIEILAAIGRQLVERLSLISPVPEVGIRHGAFLEVVGLLPDFYEFVRVLKTERFEHDAIDYAEHGGVCPNAERKGDDRYNGKPGPGGQTP